MVPRSALPPFFSLLSSSSSSLIAVWYRLILVFFCCLFSLRPEASSSSSSFRLTKVSQTVSASSFSVKISRAEGTYDQAPASRFFRVEAVFNNMQSSASADVVKVTVNDSKVSRAVSSLAEMLACDSNESCFYRKSAAEYVVRSPLTNVLSDTVVTLYRDMNRAPSS